MDFEIVFFGGIILIFLTGSILGFRTIGLSRKVKDLQTLVHRLHGRIEDLETVEKKWKNSDFSAAESAESVEKQEDIPDNSAALSSVQPSSTSAASRADEAGSQGKESRKPAESTGPGKIPRLLKNLEDRFSDRWTGILGVFALVIGFSFLAVLTALKMGQVARFLMLMVISLLFWFVSIYLNRKKGLLDASGWFQSAAGALFLFASLGASSIPWLKWVQSAPQGYALLFLGIGANLFFALRVHAQLFSSFHVLISLAALASAPPSAASLTAAAVVTAFSSVPLLRRPWGLHQFLAQGGFFVFTVLWVSHGDPNALFSFTGIDLPLFGALAGGLLPGMAAPYVRGYKHDRFANAARIAAWLYLGAGTTALGAEYKWISFLFLLLGAGAYLSGRFTRRLPEAIRRLDSIAGLALAVAAVFGFSKFNLDLYAAVEIAGLVALLAAFDVRREKVLRIVFSIAAAAASLAVLVLTIIEAGSISYGDDAGTIQAVHRLIFLYAMGGGTLVLLQFFYKKADIASRSLMAAAALGMVSLYILTGAFFDFPEWFSLGGGMVLPLTAGAALVSFLNREKLLSRLLLGLVILLHGITYLVTLPLQAIFPGDFSLNLLTLMLLVQVLVLSLPLIRRQVRALPVVFFGVLNTCTLILSFAGKHEVWLAVSLWAVVSILLYVATYIPRLRSDIARSFVICGTGVSLVAALFALMGSEPLLNQKIHGWQRIVQDVLVLASMLVWGRKRGTEASGSRNWVLFLAALAGAGFVGLEAGLVWTGLICVAAAIILLLSGRFGPRYMRSYYSFSLIFFWIGLFFLPFSGLESGSFRVEVFDLSWWTALGSVFLGLAYLGGVYGLKVAGDEYSGKLALLLTERRSAALLYPYFIGIGFFLFLSFSGPVLTSLLILESFALFTMSMILRENSFRLSSFLLILFSLGRLIILDMARSDTLERAVVFILAGAVLLGMNWMYGRIGGKAEAGKDGEQGE